MDSDVTGDHSPADRRSTADCCSDATMTRLIERHFAGRLARPEERLLRGHLLQCSSCSSYYERHLLLERLDPRRRNAQERLAAGLGLKTDNRGQTIAGGSWVATLAVAAATTAAVGLVLWLPSRQHPDDAPRGFAARGPTQGAEIRTPGPSTLKVFAVDPARQIEPAGRVTPREELAFAYRNPHGFSRLMVVGVDEKRNIYWYHPAWSETAPNREAVPIRAGPGLRELPEAIRHRLRGSHLVLFGIFGNQPLRVPDIEKLLSQRSPNDSKPLPLPGTYQSIIPLRVVHEEVP